MTEQVDPINPGSGVDPDRTAPDPGVGSVERAPALQLEAAGAREVPTGAETVPSSAQGDVATGAADEVPVAASSPESPAAAATIEVPAAAASAAEVPAAAPSPESPVAAAAAEVPAAAPSPESPVAAALSAAELAEAPRSSLEARPPAWRRRWLRFLGGFAFGLLGVFAISAGGLYAFDLQFSGRILPGVHVGEVDVSGLTASQASARLATAYSSLGDGQLVLVAGDLTFRTSFADVGRRADVDAMVADALSVGRDGGTLQRLLVDARTAARGATVEPRVIVDQAALERAVAAFVDSVAARPLDAGVQASNGEFALVPGSDGRMVDFADLATRATAAVSPLDAPSEVVVEGTLTRVEPVVTSDEANAAIEVARRMVADIVVADTSQSWTIPASQVQSWISFQPTGDGAYRAVANPAGLDDQLATIANAIQRSPVNASYLFDKTGKIVGAQEGADGRSLDARATVAAISTLLAQRASGATVASIAPVINVVKPELSTEEASATAPLMKKVSEWTTYFPISERNGYGANIWIPAMDINGYVVLPGAWFDFWKAIGPITRERGYTDGGAIINGHTEPTGALAGGICSTSTTLFNAALRAGLQMGSRQNHYYYISRYPLGLDATVWQSSSGSIQSMTFRNDTNYPILIRAYKIKDGSSGYVKFELYGVPTGRTVSISTPIVKNIQTAIDTTEYTDALPTGTTKRLETPTDGKDVWTTVTVRDASGSAIRSTTYYSHYARIDGILQIGTG